MLWGHGVTLPSSQDLDADAKEKKISDMTNIQRTPSESLVTCKARASNTGANDPQDCDWPSCGCDPLATKVLESLEEAGMLKTPNYMPFMHEAHRFIESNPLTALEMIKESHGEKFGFGLAKTISDVLNANEPIGQSSAQSPDLQQPKFSILSPSDGPVFKDLEAYELKSATHQPTYIPLRVLRSIKGDGLVTSRWTLSPEQRNAIASGQDIFLILATFGEPLQPILMAVGDGEVDPEIQRIIGV